MENVIIFQILVICKIAYGFIKVLILVEINTLKSKNAAKDKECSNISTQEGSLRRFNVRAVSLRITQLKSILSI